MPLSEKELSQQLLEWALEMELVPSDDPPPIQEVSLLLKTNETKKMWSHIIKHVRPKEEAGQIKRKAAASREEAAVEKKKKHPKHKNVKGSEQENMKNKYDELLRKRESQRSEIEDAKKRISKLKTMLVKRQENNELLCAKIESVKLKTATLGMKNCKLLKMKDQAADDTEKVTWILKKGTSSETHNEANSKDGNPVKDSLNEIEALYNSDDFNGTDVDLEAKSNAVFEKVRKNIYHVPAEKKNADIVESFQKLNGDLKQFHDSGCSELTNNSKVMNSMLDELRTCCIKTKQDINKINLENTNLESEIEELRERVLNKISPKDGSGDTDARFYTEKILDSLNKKSYKTGKDEFLTSYFKKMEEESGDLGFHKGVYEKQQKVLQKIREMKMMKLRNLDGLMEHIRNDSYIGKIESLKTDISNHAVLIYKEEFDVPRNPFLLFRGCVQDEYRMFSKLPLLRNPRSAVVSPSCRPYQITSDLIFLNMIRRITERAQSSVTNYMIDYEKEENLSQPAAPDERRFDTIEEFLELAKRSLDAGLLYGEYFEEDVNVILAGRKSAGSFKEMFE